VSLLQLSFYHENDNFNNERGLQSKQNSHMMHEFQLFYFKDIEKQKRMEREGEGHILIPPFKLLFILQRLPQIFNCCNIFLNVIGVAMQSHPV
jgi:hypothetical protein